ncbi:MAG: aminotransferase class IV [Fulvivirga sp.]|nr:aminotransferase class IV [Fulvivirga sp.]
MKYAIFNYKVVVEPLAIPFSDRALQFGDGLFETIAVKGGNVLYLNQHINRLKKGGKILNISLDHKFLQQLPDLIAQLTAKNDLTQANVKLIIWRRTKENRGYGYEGNETNYLLSCKPWVQKQAIIQQAAFASTVNLHHSPLSAIKTLNALPYILAANERSQRDVDELILLNTDGYVSECVAANIFWKNNNTYYTPSLESGCLDGVMRNVIIEKFQKNRLNIEAILARPEELLKADAIFTTNSLGMQKIGKINSTTFSTTLKYEQLLQSLWS